MYSTILLLSVHIEIFPINNLGMAWYREDFQDHLVDLSRAAKELSSI